MKAILPSTTAVLDFPILGLDPGKTTGWALATLKVLDCTDKDKVVYEVKFSVGTLEWPRDASLLEALLTRDVPLSRPRTVVFEGFRLFPQVAQSFTYSAVVPIEVIGFIRGVHHRNSSSIRTFMARPTHIVEQFSSIKTTLPDPRLREMVEDDYPNDRHARDAVRHIVHWLYSGDSL